MQRATTLIRLLYSAALVVALCVFPSIASADSLTTTSSNGDLYGFGYSFALHEKAAQKFYPTVNGTLDSIDLGLLKNGSPVDMLHVSVQADVAGNPSGTPLDSADIDLATVATSCGIHTATFSGSVLLYSGSTYWIVEERDATDTTDYPDTCGGNPGNSYDSTAALLNSGSWLTGQVTQNATINTTNSGGGGSGTTTDATSTEMVIAANGVILGATAVFFASFLTSLWIYKILL